MIIEQAIREHLLADAGVAGLVADRVYPNTVPQGSPSPVIRYSMVSHVKNMSHRGPTGLRIKRFQLDALSTSYDQAKTLAELVNKRLLGFAGEMAAAGGPGTGVVVQAVYDGGGAGDVYDDELEMYGTSADYLVWHEVA